MIPAVDLLGDDAVRLHRGDYTEVVNRLDPLELVARYRDAGARVIHLVDLTGARDGVLRPDAVRRFVQAATPAAIQASGGIRSVDDAQAVLDAGATRVVVGTAAFAHDDALEQFAQALGDRLVVAVDVRSGLIAVDGWTRDTSISADDAIERCRKAGVARILCTAIDRDGTLEGPDLALLASLRSAELGVLAAGGVRSLDDLAAIERTGCEGAIVGRALIEGHIQLTALGDT